MTAVIYARYSSAGQQETSIEFQVEDCRAFAASLGYEVVQVFADRAKSATTDRRPQFLEMIRFCEENRPDVVICWKHDRFARNRYDSAVYKSKLAKIGTRILYCKETNSEGADGIVIDALMEGMAEWYSANLSANVRRGNKKAAEKHWTLGVKVFGLMEAPDKTYTLDPVTSPLVLQAFQDYADGSSIRDIIAHVLPGFTYTRVETLLRNEKYIGRYNMYSVDEWCIPPIVPRDLFDRVQTRLAEKKHAPNARKDVYLLSGKVFCGLCKDKFTGISTKKKKPGQTYHWYVCRNHVKGCKSQYVDRDELERLVVDELVRIVHSDEIIEKLCDEFMECQENEETYIAGYAVRLAQIQKEKRNLVEAIKRSFSSELTDALDGLQAEQEEVEANIRRAQAAVFTRDEIKAFLLQFRDGDRDERWKRELVKTFLVAVWIYPPANGKPGKAVIQTTVGNKKSPDGDVADAVAEVDLSLSMPPLPAVYNSSPYIWAAVYIR